MSEATAAAPVASPTAAPSPAPSTGAGAPPPAAATPGPSGAAAPPAAPLTAKEIRWAKKHKLEDGREIDVDFSDFKVPLKIDGHEKEFTLPELARVSRLERTSYKRIEEAAAKEKQLKAETERIQRTLAALKDPKQVFRFLEETFGEQVYDLMSQRVAERVKYDRLPEQERQRLDQMTAQQRQLEKERREIETFRKEKAEWEAARKREAAERQANSWKSEWPDAFQKLGLPGDEPVMRMAFNETLALLRRAKRANVPMSIAEAQKQAAEQVQGQLDAAARYAAKKQADALAAQPGRQPPPEPVAEDAPPPPRKMGKVIRLSDI